MVSTEERASMYGWYAPDPRMRANIGIRRRLAPLLDNSRAEIELAHALLLSLPGSPCLYYGDEIGMGDNIWLPDRDARAHPDAVDPGPQRRLLHHVRPGQALPAGRAVPRAPLHGCQRRVAARPDHLAAALGARHARDPPATPGVRHRRLRAARRATARRCSRSCAPTPARRCCAWPTSRSTPRATTLDAPRPRGGRAHRRLRRRAVRHGRRRTGPCGSPWARGTSSGSGSSP